ncbi:MAG: hypothetical protein KAJ55_00650 [Anaerolineales bacterium]|nr:hypothetical protein [Anaerolineales bacterium]
MATKPYNAGEITRQLEVELFDDLGETAFAILRNLVSRSPVGDPTLWMSPSAPAGYVGGNFRRNWIVSIGAVDTRVIEGAGASGAVPLAEGLAKIESFKTSRSASLIIQNNVPYANRLALGHSSQAADGWVDEEIENGLVVPGGQKDLE